MQHNALTDPAKRGVRYHTDMNLDEVRLAFWMSVKLKVRLKIQVLSF
ncbi:MAG: Glu/Leu/Phe/Val dehydrogenase dimerization domain-containing protein [Athalassotoga sp.]